ncbi:MAG: hypothetical protein LBS45_12205 [Synergistaceae bacterium]|jgi:predicted DNA-binding protein (UPF0251 family)|nr:hypothetical protein [Synergistaceae bacterium]
MTDVALLKRVVAESGMKYAALAKRMGITREGLWNKINNRTEFKASEISSFASILRLTNEQKELIFFPIEGEFNSRDEHTA